MEIDYRNECYHCKYKKEVPGNAHIKCTNPDKTMKGNLHGIDRGWFMYPLLFDPVWKLQECKNYELAEEVKHTVSQSNKSE